MTARSCNDCAKRANGVCYLFGEHPDCGDFYPAIPYVPEPWTPRDHPEDGEYPDEPTEPTHTRQFDSSNLNSKPVRLFNGQKLYYRNKHTGDIESVIVTGSGKYRFWFLYNRAEHNLTYSAIGTRLFLSYEGALKSKK